MERSSSSSSRRSRSEAYCNCVTAAHGGAAAAGVAAVGEDPRWD